MRQEGSSNRHNLTSNTPDTYDRSNRSRENVDYNDNSLSPSRFYQSSNLDDQYKEIHENDKITFKSFNSNYNYDDFTVDENLMNIEGVPDNILIGLSETRYAQDIISEELTSIQNMIDQTIGITIPNDIYPAVAQYSPNKTNGMICIKVIRAWELPDVTPTINPYFVFDWGLLGRSQTHAIKQSTTPLYNSILRFKSPRCDDSSIRNLLLAAPPLNIYLCNRNEKGSEDDVVGEAYIDDLSQEDNLNPLIVAVECSLRNIIFTSYLEVDVFTN